MNGNRTVPLAIVGMACRFPGTSNSPQTFWQTIKTKSDCISPIPVDRWDHRLLEQLNLSADTEFARVGGFIDDIDQFDPSFFRISSREAIEIDPQHRILLELAWRCMEDAAIAPDELEKRRTGVFVGIINHDYERLMLRESPQISAFTGLGRSTSIAANRISYCLNLSGPSITFDTACSSSLTAVDAACKALTDGSADMALAGGANAILAPESYIEFSRAAMLSKSGRCRAFDAQADGFVRAEGGGLILLKRLPDALVDNDRIYATIIATQVNQDGRTVGMMAPSLYAQQTMLRTALQQSGLHPTAVGYIEAHGTGTQSGDTVEAQSLGTVYGHPNLYVGSVKTNIGHTEAAAGVAGLIKATLAVYYGEIPPNLHFSVPNPKFDCDALGIHIPVESVLWDDAVGTPRIAAVNSFGFGGANAHVIIQEAPVNKPQTSSVGNQPSIIPLSAPTLDALERLTVGVNHQLADGSVHKPDLGYTASRLPTYEFRRVIDTNGNRVGQLTLPFDTHRENSTIYSDVNDGEPCVTFVFNGIGTQWSGEGVALFHTHPAFKKTIEQCDSLFGPALGVKTAFELNATLATTDLVRAHAIHFSLQLALCEIWRSWGVSPTAVIGHSMGEIAAACVAGYLTLPAAIRLVKERAARIEPYCNQGLMLVASLNLTMAEKLVAMSSGHLVVAADNSAESVTFSGTVQAIQDLAKSLNAEGRFNRVLEVPVPFHSPMIEMARAELSFPANHRRSNAAKLPWFSSVTGAIITKESEQVDFWWQNFLGPVQFRQAMHASISSGYCIYVEIGPRASLNFNMRECIKSEDVPAHSGVIFSIHRQHSELTAMQSAAAALFDLGVDLDFSRINPLAHVCQFPNHEWNRQSYWKPKFQMHPLAQSEILTVSHPMLKEHSDQQRKQWIIPLKADEWPWFGKHRLHGELIFPAAGYIEAALAAAEQQFGRVPLKLNSIQFPNLLKIDSTVDTELTLRVLNHKAAQSFQMASNSALADNQETLHCQGQSSEGQSNSLTLTSQVPELTITTELSPTTVRNHFNQVDFDGDFEQWQITKIHTSSKGEVLATLRKNLTTDVQPSRWILDPALLDLCFRCVVGCTELKGVFMPFEVESLEYWPGLADEVNCYLHPTPIDNDVFQLDMLIANADDTILVRISKLCLRKLVNVNSPSTHLNDSLFALERGWKVYPLNHLNEARFACDWSTLQCDLEQQATQLTRATQRWRHYSIVNPALAEITTAYLAQALKQLGFATNSEKFRLEDVKLRKTIAEDQYYLIDALLKQLLSSGHLELIQPEVAEAEKCWMRWRSNSVPGPLSVVQRFLSTPESTEYLAELVLIDRCGSELSNILTGQKSGIEILFPDGATDALQQLYQSAPTCLIYNQMLKHSLVALLDSWALSRPCRILEIGAGTGALLFHLMPILRKHSTEYIFSDVSNLFIRRAKQRFGHLEFVQFRELDIDADFPAQGFDDQSFDIVLAADALHLACHPHQTLQRLQRLLNPGGVLSFIELTDKPVWADLVFGMLRDWWPKNETSRTTQSPCLSSTEWFELLDQTDFEKCIMLTDKQDGGAGVHSVFIAHKKPAETSQFDKINSDVIHRLIFADEDRFTMDFVSHFDSHAMVPVAIGNHYQSSAGRFVINPNQPKHYQRLIATLKADGNLPDDVVMLWNFNVPRVNASSISAQLLASPVLSAVRLIQAFDHHGVMPKSLTLVTANSQMIDNQVDWTGCLNAGLWGFGRTLHNEYPTLHVQLIDVNPCAASAAQRLYEFLISEHGLSEVTLRETDCYVPIQRQLEFDALTVAPPQLRVLAAHHGRGLDSLTTVIEPGLPPSDTEVVIEVSAASLNFRDVMIALGALPEDSITGGLMQWSMGMECAGRIAEVGDKVKQFARGDRVVALASRALASYVRTDQQFVVHLPQEQKLTPYSGLLTAYVTALYCFRETVRLKSSDQVLVHCASGGVGLALINVAKSSGATVFATAGTSEKRRFLNFYGVECVADSRNKSFIDKIMQWTENKGVDVVINTMSGELAAANKHVLTERGVFIELGKYHSRAEVHAEIHCFKPFVTVSTVDIDSIWKNQPDVIQRLLRETVQSVNHHELPQLPHQEFPFSQAKEAFRFMASAKHIGKIVLTADEKSNRCNRTKLPILIRPDATYLITGGTRGFGLATLLWLAENGAKHIIVVGRSPETSNQLKNIIESAEQLSCQITVLRVDVVNLSDFQTALASISRDLPPVRGVLHCAMEIADSSIVNLDIERFKKSMNAKVLGAWHLHYLTRNETLDFFVLFSSVTAVLGPAGQAAYSAANAMLDAFSDYLRQVGVPAIAINWGAVSDYGFVADRSNMTETFINQFGINPRPANEMLSALHGLLTHTHASQIIIGGGRWTTDGLRKAQITKHKRSTTPTVSQLERNKTNDLEHSIVECFSSLLDLPKDSINLDEPIVNLGVDSLLAVELSHLLRSTCQIEVSASSMLAQTSINDILTKIKYPSVNENA